MFARIKSATLIGLDATEIDVEVDIINGQLPGLTIVGLADKSVQEARERIISAIKNSNFDWPRKKIVVNLAPADVHKFGTNFDLAIAVGILASIGVINIDNISKSIFVGELALDGKVRKVPGVLPISLMAVVNKFDSIFVPEENSLEASLAQNINVYPVSNLQSLVNHLNGTLKIKKFEYSKSIFSSNKQNYEVDFAYIKGQFTLKRAALIAAAGGHNLLLVGSPGAGKTMLAKAIPSIMSDMTFKESLEVTKIYSVANLLDKNEILITRRPFRSPHHTASTASIVGGTKIPKPGEVTLAHRGVLFLDEFTEFSQSTMEALRQPLEDKKVCIARASGSVVFPADFTLVAAMNPCKCGWLGDPEKECTCSKHEIEKYRRKISGPILDRIDLQVRVNRLNLKTITENATSENSEYLKEKVNKCRNIQINRYKQYGFFSNAEIPQNLVERLCNIDKITLNYLIDIGDSLKLSARSFYRIIKTARTIADLDESETIKKVHISEALHYRIKL